MPNTDLKQKELTYPRITNSTSLVVFMKWKGHIILTSLPIYKGGKCSKQKVEYFKEGLEQILTTTKNIFLPSESRNLTLGNLFKILRNSIKGPVKVTAINGL